jgi:molybdopterin converting factor small subunit
MMTTGILLFGRLRGAFGDQPLPFPDGVRTVGDLRRRLVADHPELADRLSVSAMRVAVNQVLVAEEEATTVSPHDEIALLPPLSGG